MRLFFFLFICVSGFAQRPIAIVLDSISPGKYDNDSQKFVVGYHITNLTGKPVTFFLNADLLVPVVSSSLSHTPHYKLFMNGKSVDVSSVFESGEVVRRRFKDDAEWKTYNDSLRKTGSDPEVWKKSMGRHIAKSKMTLGANETRHFKVALRWNGERYQKQDENEYFLDPGANYELELSMHLMREELENRMDPDDFKNAMHDPTFIKGWFTSNRLPIDLSDKKIPADRE